MILLQALFAALLGQAAVVNGNGVSAGLEVPMIRDFFYIGGVYVSDGAGGHIYRDQMYVERLQPTRHSSSSKPPIVIFHGQAQTGTVS